MKRRTLLKLVGAASLTPASLMKPTPDVRIRYDPATDHDCTFPRPSWSTLDRLTLEFIKTKIRKG